MLCSRFWEFPKNRLAVLMIREATQVLEPNFLCFGDELPNNYALPARRRELGYLVQGFRWFFRSQDL